jgi:heat shock protein HslJ
MNRRLAGAMGAVISILLLAGCDAMATRPATAAVLDGTAWLLAELPGQALVGEGKVTLQFTGDRASGSDGCNRFSGGYTTDGVALAFAQLASTQMACEPAVMEQAGRIAGALTATRSYRIDGERLELRAADGQPLAVYAAQSMRVEGTAWDVTGINNGKGAVVSVAAGTNVTLEFAADGRAAGTAGCNRYNATFTAERESLQFGPAAATRRMCATPGVMEQEQAFLQALTKVKTMHMEGDRLELRGADGALAVTLRRAASPK